MLPDKLSFVDIETTGTSMLRSRIIEIGIVQVEQNTVVREFSSLINPQTYLDPFITSLTGIHSEDLERAPTFHELRHEILGLLKDSVFVAHNVRFDYGFLRNEFKRHDISFFSKHFCTVKLARFLYPGQKSYNLDSIIKRFGITCINRHRALDDAKVLWEFYKQSMQQMPSDVFDASVARALKRPSLPIGLSQEDLDRLPESPGVYIFYGDNNTILYIGKSINVRERVLSHFSSDYIQPVDLKISRQVKSIAVFPTAGELGALFLESTLIKRHQPLFNRQLRQTRQLLALKKTVAKDGYNTVLPIVLQDVPVSELNQILGIFPTRKRMKDFLYQFSREYHLCPRILGLEKGKGICFSYHLGQCRGACDKKEQVIRYNLRFDEAFYKARITPWPFSGPICIKETGESEEVFIVDKWCLLGSIRHENDSFDEIKQEYIFDYDTYKILMKYLKQKKNIASVLELRSMSLENRNQIFTLNTLGFPA